MVKAWPRPATAGRVAISPMHSTDQHSSILPHHNMNNLHEPAGSQKFMHSKTSLASFPSSVTVPVSVALKPVVVRKILCRPYGCNGNLLISYETSSNQRPECPQPPPSTKPMFKINKPLLIPKNILVMWHNIWWHVIKYFATSLESCHVENEYINNIPWHAMECSQRFCLAHVSLLTYSPTSVIGHQHAPKDVS